MNNVTRLLDSANIQYSLYRLPAEKLGALQTASLLKVDAAIVYKTIVITRARPKKPLLVLVPGNKEVDLKLLAKALGEKKVYLASEQGAESMTGLQAGGISPLALINKGFKVLIDASAQSHTQIHVSGGQRGLNIKLAVIDLASLTDAHFAKVTQSDVFTQNTG